MLNKISKLIVVIGFVALAASPLLVYAQTNPIGAPLQLPIPGVNEPATKPATTSANSNSATTTPPAQTPTELPVYNAGVDRSIQDYLCTPSQPADGHDLERCVNRLYRFGISAGALVLVFLIIYAGYIYITSDESGKTKAKGYIKNSLTGMGILLGSYVLLNFINPSLVTFKPIQPPIFNAADLPSCKDLGFGDNCLVASGGESGNDSVQPGTGGGTATACRGGLTCGGPIKNNFPNYEQKASPWGPTKYGNKANCSSMAEGGCGPTSVAIALTYFKQKGLLKPDPKIQSKYGTDVTPTTTQALATSMGYRVCPGGSAHALPAGVGKLYGLNSRTGSWDQAVTALKAGIPVIVTMKAKTPFTDGGHFITMVAIDNEKVYFSDSGPRRVTAAPIAVTKSSISSITIMN